MATIRIVALVMCVAWSAAAGATDIAPQCLASSNVKDSILLVGVSTVSCRQLELRRADLFKTINSLPKSGTLNGTQIAGEIAAYEARLKKMEEERDWVSVGSSVSGNFLATLGLTACAAGPWPCTGAIIGKVLSMVDIVGSSASEAAKTKQLGGIRADLAKLRTDVEKKTPPIDKVRERLVLEFNDMCTAVQSQCVK